MIRKIIIKVNEGAEFDIFSKDKFSAHESMCLANTFLIAAAEIEGVEIDEMQNRIGDYVKIVRAGLKPGLKQ